MKTLCFLLVFIFVMAGLAAAQVRSVTNADLEKYKDARIKAETDLRENYAKLGFPSPEELERQRIAYMQDVHETAERLRAEQAERARLDAAQNAYSSPGSTYYVLVPDGQDYLGSGYLLSYGPDRRFQLRRGTAQPGYFAGGQFWPTPRVQRQRPTKWIRQR